MKITVVLEDIQLADLNILSSLTSAISNNLIIGEKVMATLQEVQDAIAKLQADTVAEAQEVSAALATLTTQITDLQTQVATGTVVSAADLDVLLQQIQGADALVQAIITPAAPV
jgi:hypothetical protein